MFTVTKTYHLKIASKTVCVTKNDRGWGVECEHSTGNYCKLFGEKLKEDRTEQASYPYRCEACKLADDSDYNECVPSVKIFG